MRGLLVFLGLGATVGGLLLWWVANVMVPGLAIAVGGLIVAMLLGALIGETSARDLASFRAPDALVQRAIGEGRAALVRVDANEMRPHDDGRNVSGWLTLTVQPQVGPAFRTRIARRLTGPESVPYRVGAVLPGVVLTDDGPEVDVVIDSRFAAEVLARTAGLEVPRAEQAGPIRQARNGLIGDDGRFIPEPPGPTGAARVVRNVAGLVAFAVGLGAPLAAFPDPVMTAVTALTEDGRLRPRAWDAENLPKQLGRLADELGHRRVLKVYSRGEEILWVQAFRDPSDLRIDDYEIPSYGMMRVSSDTADRPEDGFSLDEVDWTVIEGLVQRAEAELADHEIKRRSFTVERADDGDAPGEVEITISITTRQGDAQFRADADGGDFRMNGGDLYVLEDGYTLAPDYLATIMPLMIERIGHAEAVEVSVGPKSVSVTVADLPEGRSETTWQARGLDISRSYTDERFDDSPSFLLTDVDWAVAPDVVRQAMSASGIDDLTEAWLSVEQVSDGETSAPKMEVRVNLAEGYALFHADLDGTGLERIR